MGSICWTRNFRLLINSAAQLLCCFCQQGCHKWTCGSYLEVPPCGNGAVDIFPAVLLSHQPLDQVTGDAHQWLWGSLGRPCPVCGGQRSGPGPYEPSVPITEPVCSSGVSCCLLPSCGTNMKTWVPESRLVLPRPAQVAVGKHLVLPVQFVHEGRTCLPSALYSVSFTAVLEQV